MPDAATRRALIFQDLAARTLVKALQSPLFVRKTRELALKYRG